MACFWTLFVFLFMALSSQDATETVADKLKSASFRKQAASADVADIVQDAVSSEDPGLRLNSDANEGMDVSSRNAVQSDEISEQDVQSQSDIKAVNKKIINPDAKFSVMYMIEKLSSDLNLDLDTGEWTTVSLLGALCFHLTLFLVLCICVTILCSTLCNRRRRVKKIRRERLLDDIATILKREEL